MRQKQMTRGGDANEVMAFKYHYLNCVVEEVIKCQKRKEAQKAKQADAKKEETEKKEATKESKEENKTEESNEERKREAAEFLIRTFLKCSKSEGTPEYQEAFLREVVREFPYRESIIFRQMVATLASTDPPSALSVVSAAINGQKGFYDNVQICVTCEEEKATKKCSKCKAVQYCDRECQRLHWFVHKKSCARAGQSPASAKMSDADKEQLNSIISSRLKNASIN